jgi:hypothetical protein
LSSVSIDCNTLNLNKSERTQSNATMVQLGHFSWSGDYEENHADSLDLSIAEPKISSVVGSAITAVYVVTDRKRGTGLNKKIGFHF